MSNLHTGSTALITGANSGVGLELTKRLLGEGWDVIALIRSGFEADQPLIREARDEGRLRVYHADLSDFHSLSDALDQIKSQETRIDVLFNNAAAAVGGIARSPQGREMHFEVNTVVPYVILMELKPLLAQGSLKTVINISSNALLTVRRFTLEALQHPTRYKAISGPYGASKLALSLWTEELAPALLADGIEIRSACPGPNKTKMTNSEHFPKWLLLIRHLFFHHASEGAARLYSAAFGAWRGKTGIFVNRGKATPLKFGQHRQAVLDTVQAIYAQEFLHAPAMVA